MTSDVLNRDLRIKIASIIKNAGEGHIPSSFSIVDIINFLYENVLSFNYNDPDDPTRDYFILSKGHGCAALYVVLEKFKIIKNKDLEKYSHADGFLGGHPDKTLVPGAEASTGSLGHGFPTALGIAIGLKIQKKPNKVISLVGDGECHEGTIWESANVAANRRLDNLTVIVDWNGSAAQLMPIDKLDEKWRSFGWEVRVIDGHSFSELSEIFINNEVFLKSNKPRVILAKTVKGKGVPFIEGHGKWHHKIPTDDELREIINHLSN